MRPKSERHISQMSAAPHDWDGYWVRLLDRRGKAGKYISSTFPASRYKGSMPKALAAAKKWRDSKMVELGYPKTGTFTTPGLSHLAGKSHVKKRGFQPELPIGVTEQRKDRKSGGVHCCFIARISPQPMKVKFMRFNYDDEVLCDRERALKLAINQRKAWEKEYYSICK